jgi:hypothetical protein
MTIQNTNVNELVGQVVLKITQLPSEDLPLVIEFVDYLAQQRQVIPTTSLSIAEIRAKARQRAQELSQMPRAEIVARFQTLAEDIRQTAIGNNTAIDGDWPGG